MSQKDNLIFFSISNRYILKLHYFILLILLIFISSTTVIGQKIKYKQLTDSLYTVWSENERIAKFDELLNEFVKTNGEEEAAIMANGISLTYFDDRDYPTVLRFSRKESDYYEMIKLKNSAYAKAIYISGNMLTKLDLVDSAMRCYQKIIDENIDPVRTALAYCRIGNCYNKKGDFYKAISFYKRGINQLEALEDYNYMINPCIYLSYLYQRIPKKSYQNERLANINKLIMLKEKEGFSLSRTVNFHNILAAYYNSEENSSGEYNFLKAKYHYQQAIKYSRSINSTASLSTIYSNFGNLYQKEKKDSAIFFLEKSLALKPKQNEQILIYRNLFDYYFHRNQLMKALESINKSLAVNLSVREDSVDDVGYDQYYNSFSQDEILSAIVKKVHVLIRLEKENNERNHFLRLAEKIIDIGDRLITSVQNESTTEDSKLYWRVRATDIYSKGVLLAGKLNNYEKAFYYSEKIKSLLLIENILAESSKDSLPDEINAREKALKSEILAKEKQLRNTSDEKLQKQLKAEIVNHKVTYQTFLDSIQYIYPEIYAKKNNVEIADLELLQSQLSDSTAIVSYVWDIDDENYDYIYFLLITKSECKVHLINDAPGLAKLIDSFKRIVAKPFETMHEKEEFQLQAYQLYLKLFPSEQIRNSIKGKKLLILPDHIIHGIPFEALISEPKSDSYLILENEISYAYSMSFLFHNEKIKREPSKQMISFSPVSFKYDELAPLKRSESEILEIDQIIDGKTLTNESSTKAAFFSESGDFKIIHLATHAQTGDNPWIAFSDAKMDIAELYTFQNQSELVVLSACNTSRGEIAEGEGVLSLARSFFYSGANAIIATEWNVNDKSTSFIFKEFYTNLKNGESKSAALRNAKLHYLKNHSLSDVSPYYWASFTLLGSDNPIDLQFPRSNFKWWLTGLLIACILLFAFYLKKRQKKR